MFSRCVGSIDGGVEDALAVLDTARYVERTRRGSFTGTGDHLVSEAVYLNDPEGNGIEIYVDRPSNVWRRSGGMIEMTTDPLDLESLLKISSETAWSGFPDEGVVGHVHLQVGDLGASDGFYRDLLGLRYRPGDEPVAAGQPDPRGQDWLVLQDGDGVARLAFQQVPHLPEATWPQGPHPQMLHLDLTVPTTAELDRQHSRALSLGARLLLRVADGHAPREVEVVADVGHLRDAGERAQRER